MDILESRKKMSFLMIMTRVVFFGIILAICLHLAVDRVRAQGTIPEAEQLKRFSQDTMLDFALAVKAKDFTVFYKNIAKLWQAQTTNEELANVFKSFSDQNIDLMSLQDVDPIFTPPPQLDENGWLILQGYYPSQPSVTYFSLKYLEEDSEWKLVGINVDLQEEPLPESEEEELPAEDASPQPTQESLEWEQLNNEAIALYEEEQYAEALKVAQKALNIAREAYGQMVIAKATAIVTNALRSYHGKQPSLADNPDYVAAVKALEHPALQDSGELVGAIFMTAPNFSDPELFLEPSANEGAIQLLRDYAQKPSLPPYSLIAFATSHARGASYLVLTVIFPKGTDANAAADVVTDRLQHYVSVDPDTPLNERWTFEKAVGVEVQGLPVTLAVMRVDDPPPTPQDAPQINANVFTWLTLISKRNTLFLIPGDIPELPEQ